MLTKTQKAIAGGIAGTAAMTLIMYIGSLIGMPKMSPPAMVSMMTGLPLAAGWLMHFLIGVIFAMSYSFFFIHVVKKISNKLVRGALFGLTVFLFAQIAMALLEALSAEIPPMEGNLILLMAGSILGHIVFGMVAVMLIQEQEE